MNGPTGAPTGIDALHLDQLSVPFGQGPGLSGIELRVAPGERVVLLGASGTGKTSLLRGIAGLAAVTAGRIWTGGVEVTALPPEQRQMVYLHQTPLLFPHLDVFENVAFPLRLRGWTAAEIRVRVADLLAAVQLEAFGTRSTLALSGGQRHRVALARAIAARPRVLLLDEPLTGLDARLRVETRQALLALGREGDVAMLLVTHDLSDASILGHRVGVLAGGGLAQCDRPAELFRHPASLAVAEALGFPNHAVGHFDGGRFHSPLGAMMVEAGRLPSPGPVVAVFRAEAIRADPSGPLEGVVVAGRMGPLGTVLVLELGGQRFEALDHGNLSVEPGSRVRVALDAGQVHLFAEPADVR